MVPLLPLLLAPAHAAQSHHDVLTAGTGTPVERAQLALVDAPEHTPPRVLAAAGGQTVRVDQTYQGLPVLGASAAVRVRPDGSVPLVVSNLRPGLAVGTTPTLTAAGALETAELPVAFASRAELAVLPRGAGVLVWAVTLPDAQGGEHVVLDAHTGDILARRPAAVHVQGRVYADNPVSTPDTSDVELVDLDSSGTLTGRGGNLQVLQYTGGNATGTLQVEQTLGPNSGDDFLYDPPADPLDGTDAFAQVNTWHHLSQAARYFEALTGADMSGADWDLAVVTNVQSDGEPMDNAYFSPAGHEGDFAAPNLVAIGQGTRVDFALDGDVVVHEFGHYISHNAVGYNQGQLGVNAYGLFPWTGAIDEGVADYFAASRYGNPVIGETSLASFGASRDLSTYDGACPADAVFEVHAAGELIGATGWDLHQAYGADVADQLMWGALTLMTADSDLGDFGSALEQIGAELEADGVITDLAPLTTALADRGLDRCGVVQDLGLGAFDTHLFGLDVVASGFGVPCESAQGFIELQSVFHFSLETAPDAVGARFDVSLDPQNGGALGWRVVLREGQHVGFESGAFLPEVGAFDVESETFTETEGAIEVTGDDFTPGSTWYGVIVYNNCPNAMATVSGESLSPVDTDPPDTDDTDPADTDVPGDSEGPGPEGCGCGGGAAGGGWLVLMGLVALRRRRR